MPEPTAAPAMTLSADQFQQLLAAVGGGGISKEVLQEVLSHTSQDTRKALDPSNLQHPEKSHMSYPEGDVARPRPKLAWELLWNGYPQHKFQEELMWFEVELMTGQRREPDGTLVTIGPGLTGGEFTCSKNGGHTTFPITVKASVNGDGKVWKLDVTFSKRREDKDHFPPLFVTLYQMTHREMSPMQSYVRGMAAYLEAMYGAEMAVPA